MPESPSAQGALVDQRQLPVKNRVSAPVPPKIDAAGSDIEDNIISSIEADVNVSTITTLDGGCKEASLAETMSIAVKLRVSAPDPPSREPAETLALMISESAPAPAFKVVLVNAPVNVMLSPSAPRSTESEPAAVSTKPVTRDRP